MKLTKDQCIFAEDVIPGICERGHWTSHTCAGAPDHIHVVLISEFDPETIRKLLKLIGAGIIRAVAVAEGQSWWAEGGSTKWINDKAYFENATAYVARQRIRRI